MSVSIVSFVLSVYMISYKTEKEGEKEKQNKELADDGSNRASSIHVITWFVSHSWFFSTYKKIKLIKSVFSFYLLKNPSPRDALKQIID